VLKRVEAAHNQLPKIIQGVKFADGLKVIATPISNLACHSESKAAGPTPHPQHSFHWRGCGGSCSIWILPVRDVLGRLWWI